MAKDINFTKISRRDILERKEMIDSAIKNKNDGIMDKDVSRSDLVVISDKVFFNHVMLAFENNQNTNSCFFNDFKDRTDSDFSKSYNTELDPLNTCLKVKNRDDYAEYYTRKIHNNNEMPSTMNDFYLIVDQEVPKNSTVTYYIVTDKEEVFPIEANNKVALSIKDQNSLPTKIRIKAYIRHGAGDMPLRIKGIALLYNDSYVDSQVDIFNPDFDMDVIETPEEILTLFRDPNNGDRLFKIESEVERTVIKYNEDGELDSVNSFNVRSNNLTQRTEMIYEDYTSSEGKTEKTLTKIRSRNSLAPWRT
ncbi:MAG: hypothetical protein RR744_09395 [Cellulosilyticaceae bacterium]